MSRAISESQYHVVGAGRSDRGMTLVEVMVAMVVAAIGLAGTIGMFEWAERGLRAGAAGTRALALVESRLESKRVVPWERLLVDSGESDGGAQSWMHDDGEAPDAVAGDGIYSAGTEVDGIQLMWTVRPNRPGRLVDSGYVQIEAAATYSAWAGKNRTITLKTGRGNPRFVGAS